MDFLFYQETRKYLIIKANLGQGVIFSNPVLLFK